MFDKHNIAATMPEWCFQRTTYRKPHIASPMVTWTMTSCDHKWSGSWPQHTESLVSLYLSIHAPIVHNFYLILMKFCTVVWGPKRKKVFIRGQNPMIPSLFCLNFSSHNALSMGMAEHHSKEACWPTVVVNDSNDVSWERLYDQN